MHRCLFLILFLPFLRIDAIVAQEKETVALMTGKVVSVMDSAVLNGVHVINLNTLVGTISGDSGSFEIPIRLHDRILFSYLGYEVDTFFISKEFLTHPYTIKIELIETSYLLSIFKVLSISTFEEFEKAFLALELPDEEVQFNMPPPAAYQRLPENQSFTIAIPFDLSYFTKKARDLRKYKAMLAQDQKKQVIYARYNPMVVEVVTGINDAKKAQDLMDYCNFSDEFVKNAIGL